MAEKLEVGGAGCRKARSMKAGSNKAGSRGAFLPLPGIFDTLTHKHLALQNFLGVPGVRLFLPQVSAPRGPALPGFSPTERGGQGSHAFFSGILDEVRQRISK